MVEPVRKKFILEPSPLATVERAKRGRFVLPPVRSPFPPPPAALGASDVWGSGGSLTGGVDYISIGVGFPAALGRWRRRRCCGIRYSWPPSISSSCSPVAVAGLWGGSRVDLEALWLL
jgi:hypothetical protein